MQELANPLVARPRQPQPLGLSSEPPVQLGEGEARVVDAVEDPEEARGDPRSEGEHAPSVLEKSSRVCARSQVTLCHKAVLRSSYAAAVVSTGAPSRASKAAMSTSCSKVRPISSRPFRRQWRWNSSSSKG